MFPKIWIIIIMDSFRVHDICVRVCTGEGGEGEEEQAGAVKDTRSESECTRDTRPTRSYEQYRTPVAERYDSTHTKKSIYTRMLMHSLHDCID